MQGHPAQPTAVRSDGQAVPWLTTTLGSACGTQSPAWQDWGCCRAASAPILSPYSRLFEYRGRVSPVPRVVPVKRPRVTIPLVRRVKATLPVKLFTRSAAIANSSAKLKCKCVCGVQRVGRAWCAHGSPIPRHSPTGLGGPGENPPKAKMGKQQPK